MMEAPDQAKQARRVLAVASVGGLLAGVNTSAIAVALPTISRHFEASSSGASWTLLAYILTTTVLVLVLGRVADMVGRRRMFVAGLVLLTVGSLLCGLAPSIGWLIGFRCVQAVGAAALLANVTALITDVYPPTRLAPALGINGTIGALAQVIGPVVGGLLATGLGWQATFWFNVPLGVAVTLWAFVVLPPDSKLSGGYERFDIGGAVFGSLCLAGLLIALSEGGAQGWSNPLVLISAIVAVVAGPVFIGWERTRRHPMLDLSLLGQRSRSLAYLSLLLMSIGYFAVVTVVALYLQAAGDSTAFAAGLHVLWVALAMAVTASFAGPLSQRLGVRTVTSLGIILTTVGVTVSAFVVRPDVNEWWLTACLIATGAGPGLFMTPNTTSIMNSVAANRRGIANGIRQTAQNTGYALSTALSLAILTAALPAVDRQAAYAGSLATTVPESLNSLTVGYRWAAFALAGCCLLALVASFLRGPEQREVPAVADANRCPAGQLQPVASDKGSDSGPMSHCLGQHGEAT